jgi:hypothetical protein
MFFRMTILLSGEVVMAEPGKLSKTEYGPKPALCGEEVPVSCSAGSAMTTVDIEVHAERGMARASECQDWHWGVEPRLRRQRSLTRSIQSLQRRPRDADDPHDETEQVSGSEREALCH